MLFKMYSIFSGQIPNEHVFEKGSDTINGDSSFAKLMLQRWRFMNIVSIDIDHIYGTQVQNGIMNENGMAITSMYAK